jgi:hypothetical protein
MEVQQVSFQKKAVGFYTKGKGKDRKVVPITSSSGRFSMSNMTSALTSMPEGEREKKREEVIEKYYDGDRKAFERDVEERPMYVGRLLMAAPTVQKFKRPTPKRHFKLKPEEPKEQEAELESYFYNKLEDEGLKPPKKADAPTNSWWLAFDAKVDPKLSTKENKKRLDATVEMIVDQEKRKEKKVREASKSKVKIGKKPKPKTEMTHIERMHLLTMAKKYELDTQEIDNTLNYYENKKHLEGLAREKGFSQEEIEGSKAALEEDVSQHEEYLHHLRNELEEAGYTVIEPNV